MTLATDLLYLVGVGHRGHHPHQLHQLRGHVPGLGLHPD
jgi:hypothetical protein